MNSPQKSFFTQLFGTEKQLWTVCYADTSIKEITQDLCESFENGAHAVVLENHNKNEMMKIIKEILPLFPHQTLGVNILGPDSHLMTYRETFEVCSEYNLKIAWTDFSGVDLIHEAPEVSLHEIDSLKPVHTFYASGIHMKYSTLKNSTKTIEKSAQQAMGWVDGIIITGSATGCEINSKVPTQVREVIGDYPLGIASGVSSENIHHVLSSIDFVLANSSIADKNHRIIGSKVRELKNKMS